ncbi:twin-arginine translocation signal domain-containing protein [Blastopirellula sp. JC732]|uniref:Twin-arginine translocation signal domain-containing protein n=1 Tax=Blastopirellula sediminis TaxID=2894196 RepID=A0A9X1MPJ0_9BACT|nr:twin-arginine translocation signal domain-containing protein [Blastopirellula sediminis]MCC9606703.1 twin-arginine translocation signal domain-containing protein [Blastopirellula sediminis]MCC9630000.1 twin-arginine translocation signal domain-containing protein [Blastopirellula sediminis]
MSSPSSVSRRRFLQTSAILAGAAYAGNSAFAESRVTPPFEKIVCAGRYPGHLQGICIDDAGYLYWPFTDQLVKTDSTGKIVKQIPVVSHHGDLCYADGKIYVAVNLGQFNQPAGKADSWVYVYDAETLKELDRVETQEVVHGAGGMSVRDGHFYVIGGLPPGIEENYVYEYDADLHFVKRHVIDSKYSLMGIQSANFHDGYWWFGCYGKPAELIKTDVDFKMLGRWPYDCSLGVVGIAPGKFLIGRNTRDKAGHEGFVVPAVPDEKTGLRDVV